jgi:hypothetical protein
MGWRTDHHACGEFNPLFLIRAEILGEKEVSIRGAAASRLRRPGESLSVFFVTLFQAFPRADHTNRRPDDAFFSVILTPNSRLDVEANVQCVILDPKLQIAAARKSEQLLVQGPCLFRVRMLHHGAEITDGHWNCPMTGVQGISNCLFKCRRRVEPLISCLAFIHVIRCHVLGYCAVSRRCQAQNF